MSIVYRQELGRELTWSEADNNFAELKAGVDSKKSNFDVLPVTQGGTGQTSVDAVKIAFDIATKTDLASSAAGKGAELVEYQGATVEAALNERLPEIGTYALLRAYTGPVTSFLVRGVANIFDGGFGVFRVDASDTTTADNGGTVLIDASGRRWKRDYAGDVNAKWFGAVGDGVTDDTAAIQAAINAVIAARTSPSGFSSRGQNVLFFPKGKYLVSDGLIFASSAIGFEIRGAVAYATSFEFTSDSAAFITANTFIRFTLRDITVNHIAQNADSSTWTNSMFKGTGVGGGRMLALKDCVFNGFNHVISNIGSANFDTFRADGCDFLNFNVCYAGRNSQSVANTFKHCTFYGKGDVMQAGGIGHTIFDTCSIVVDGAWLRLYGASGLWGPTAQFTFINVKGEPLNLSGFAGGSRSSVVLLDGDKSLISCQIKLINSGMTSTVALDTDTAHPQIEMTSNMNVDWQGGQLKETSKIKLVPVQTINFNSLNHRGLFFDGLRLAPPPSQITRDAPSTSSTTWPQVVYERCQSIPNICIGADVSAITQVSFPPVMDRAQQLNCLGSGSQYYGVLSFGSALTHTLDFYASRQVIVDVAVQVAKKSDSNPLKVEISLDNFSTVLDTIYVAGAAGSYLATARITDHVYGSKTYDPPSLTTGAQQSTAVSVLGARAGDQVQVSLTSALSGTRLWGEVTADDTVTVYHRNDTGVTVDVASGTLTASVKRANTAVNKVGNDKLYVRCSGSGAYGYLYATIRAA